MRVWNTASQIIRTSWCYLGGPVRRGEPFPAEICWVSDMVKIPKGFSVPAVVSAHARSPSR